MLNTEVLVLNKSFQPVNVIDVKRGFAMLYSGIAKALDDEYQMFDFESWTTLSDAVHENMIGTPRGHLRIPRVLVLQLGDKLERVQRHDAVVVVGGLGSIPGAAIGALFVGILLQGLTMMNAPYYMQDFVKGAVLVAALVFTFYLSSRRGGRRTA